MMQRRWKLSLAQRVELWRRWKAGESLHAIGRALGKQHNVIRFLLARHGGIAPAARRRSGRALTLVEREDISRGIAGARSMRLIAQGLSCAPSTVSREVARHGGRAQYRASEADQHAWELALRPAAGFLRMRLMRSVECKSANVQGLSQPGLTGTARQRKQATYVLAEVALQLPRFLKTCLPLSRLPAERQARPSTFQVRPGQV